MFRIIDHHRGMQHSGVSRYALKRWLKVYHPVLIEILSIKKQRCIVDCEWDKWKTGECSKSCGGGELYITRNKISEARNGGKGCAGNSSIVQECNVEACPS